MSLTFINRSECSFLGTNNTIEHSMQADIELWQTYLLFIALGVFSALLATFFNFIRSKIYKEKSNVDADFDAGGKVSVGLTASTIVSQWTWAATLLQSSSVASKYGISGPFWYASGATIQILLFSMLSVQLKIKAPGAKTFLQVIKARFGSRTHIVFCVFALMTNVIVTAMLMLGGAAVMTSLVKDLNIELATTLVAAIIGSYTYIGGLGATFYVSYFNTAIIFSIMLVFLNKVYNDDDPENPLGSVGNIYNFVSCVKGPDGNLENSYLTMASNPGLMFGFINIVGNFGTVFVDQSYWQSSVAAKPKQGVYGFLIGGLVWFAVPFTFATTMGLAYTALGANDGIPLLTDDDVNAGLVAPAVAQRLMGKTGEFLILIMMLMAVTSTGSAEVIAVTSILIYDVYQLYLKPYRLVHDANSCVLCGRSRGRMANPRDKCVCISMTHCSQCEKDDISRESFKNRPLKPDFLCKIHGQFRLYNEYLIRLKNWCILWTTMTIIPLTIILNVMQVSLGWVYLFMGILIGSAVVPIALCMFWTRLTGIGMMSGSIIGAIIAIIVWLSTAASRPGGLRNFFENTGSEVSMLAGNIVAIVLGGVITVVVSLITSRNQVHDANEIWENTRDIDNPLTPWTEAYARELQLHGTRKLDNRPEQSEVEDAFKSARYTAIIGALSLTFILIIVWPATIPATGVFTLSTFTTWVSISAAWGITAAIVIIILPVINESWEIYTDVKKRRTTIPTISLENVASKQTLNSQKNSQQNMLSFNNRTTNHTVQSVPPQLQTEPKENDNPMSGNALVNGTDLQNGSHSGISNEEDIDTGAYTTRNEAGQSNGTISSISNTEQINIRDLGATSATQVQNLVCESEQISAVFP